ncbi:hypothetical protein EFP44_04490 [Lacticaseibacillus paracasei]|nr:hypothetical protein [Lacticaseibacillus paracasei]
MTFRRSCSHLTLTGSVYLDLGRAGQRTAITPRATYMPTSNRAGSRFHKKSRHWAGQKQVWFL